MKKLLRFPIILTFVLVLSFVYSCKKDSSEPDPLPVPTERERIINLYNANYLGSVVTDPGWSGHLGSCLAGSVSADAQAKTLLRIKYYREMASLPTDISFDPSNDAKCQQAALMMHANNSLSHTPPTSWTCYTADGNTAAGSSNIALGMHTSGAISGFIDDFWHWQRSGGSPPLAVIFKSKSAWTWFHIQCICYLGVWKQRQYPSLYSRIYCLASKRLCACSRCVWSLVIWHSRC